MSCANDAAACLPSRSLCLPDDGLLRHGRMAVGANRASRSSRWSVNRLDWGAVRRRSGRRGARGEASDWGHVLLLSIYAV